VATNPLRSVCSVMLPKQNNMPKTGNLVGHWSSEINAQNLNQIVDLRMYDDFEDRTRCNKALASNRDWTDFWTNSKSMVVSQRNTVLKQFPWYPLCPPSEPNTVYELRIYRLYAGAVPKWAERFQKGLSTRLQFSKPFGIWFSDIGELNCVVHLWPYRSLAHRAEVRDAGVQNEVWATTVTETMPLIQKMESKILTPTSLSPLR